MIDNNRINDRTSPALKHQIHWRGKVPKRIKILKGVASNLPFPPLLEVNPGETYDCYVNSYGVVSVYIDNDSLGLKPDDFKVIEFHKK